MKVIVNKGLGGKEHRSVIYTEEEAQEHGIEYLEDWRSVTEAGQWILCDDGFVAPVEKVWKRIFRIPTGTFSTGSKSCDTRRRKNRFAVASNQFRFASEPSKPHTSRAIRLFVKQIVHGMDLDSAARQAWPKSNGAQIRNRLSWLLRSKVVNEMIKKEVGDALAEAGVDEKWVIDKYKQLVDGDEAKPADRITVLKEISKMLCMVPGQQGKEIPGSPYGGYVRLREIEISEPNEPEKLPEVAGSGVNSRNLIGQNIDLDENGSD